MPRSVGLTNRDRALVARVGRTSSSIPGATYRLQLHAGFPFRAARAIVPYLARLGVTHLYASPIWSSTSGSLHGYDVVDFGEIDQELGGRQGFDELAATLDRYGLSLILDFVPNHMGIGGGANPWWQDVLEHGQASAFAGFFDIDWLPLKHELRDQVLVPVLGDQFGVVLERGELTLEHVDGEFHIDYFGTPFPVAPPTYPMILGSVLEAVRPRYDANDASMLELESIVSAFERLPPNHETDPARLAERAREQVVSKRRLAQLVQAEAPMRHALAAEIERLNGNSGDRTSFNELEALLDQQSYRLAYWRVAAEEINYRRFFAINELAAIRQEVPAVFTATHRLLLDLIREGRVAGVRIDHPDGLWDPGTYFRDLQLEAFTERARAAIEARRSKPVDESWWQARRPELPGIRSEIRKERADLALIYLVIEKILEEGENLPSDWPVAGTVGYEFASVVTGLFVDQTSRKAFDELYRRFAGSRISFADLIYEQKKRIMREALVSEVNVLARSLDRLTERNRRTRDFTLNNLRYAMREIIACFPVYRTYIECHEGRISQRDRRWIDDAVNQALRRNRGSDRGVFEFIRGVLLLQIPNDAPDVERAEYCRFVMKFQQLTGPVMAKGVEDSAFYQYNRLLSLNEVGGDPASFGATVSDFHQQCTRRAQDWPTGLLASSTHDTKRSEDVRARISALSEMPREWRAAVNRWARMNRRLKHRVQGAPAPDRNDEYHFYQTLVGVWPFDGQPDAMVRDRIHDYMIKAAREAQTQTSWIRPNEEYESALSSFVTSALTPGTRNAFLEDFRQFMPLVMRIGAFTSLAQQLLKLTSPGVPDLYQGTELWDFSLVDPDNRRPVDFECRTTALAQLDSCDMSPDLAAELLNELPSGLIKLYLTARALAHRAAHPDLYARGEYVPLLTRGPQADNLVAFARTHGDAQSIVVVPRLVRRALPEPDGAPIGKVWNGASVLIEQADGGARFHNELTGETVTSIETEEGAVLDVAEILRTFPVALLRRERSATPPRTQRKRKAP